MCGSYDVHRGNYFRGEPIRKTEVEVRVRMFKNGMAAGKGVATGEMVKDGGDIVVDWIWRMCNMAFESGVVHEDWTSVVIVSQYKGKGERTECKNYIQSSPLYPCIVKQSQQIT